MFSTQIFFKNRLARFARSQSCNFLQFPTRRHSIRPFIMNILNEPTQGLIVPTNKYAAYQLNNRTFSTQNTKISARSLAISYICFQVRIVKKKKKKTILSTTTENLVTPAPPTPDKGSIREIATGKITVSITPDDHLEGPYLLKTRELPGAQPPGPPAGALPLHPARGPTAGPWAPPV